MNLLRQAAEEAGKAWSGSWLGYHANIYYSDLQAPPPGAHFSPEWGLKRMAFVSDASTGDWVEYDPDQVSKVIYVRAGKPDVSLAMEFNRSARIEFARQKGNLLSIIEVESQNTPSPYLMGQKEAATNLSLISEDQYVQSWMPSESNSRDSLALYQGHWVPPHVRILAKVATTQMTIDVVSSLAEVAKQVASHASRQRQQPISSPSLGTRVFIGHGRSPIWRELKDFLEDQLGLLVDEFNSVSAAGVATAERLSAMMDSAAIALLVMTGEDEQPSGEFRPRENVVHEAGLFQGRLGFQRAIVLLEEGCEKFSNNAGLGHINFPRNNIKGCLPGRKGALGTRGNLGLRNLPMIPVAFKCLVKVDIPQIRGIQPRAARKSIRRRRPSFP